jgi:hypothetical protein
LEHGRVSTPLATSSGNFHFPPQDSVAGGEITSTPTVEAILDRERGDR